MDGRSLRLAQAAYETCRHFLTAGHAHHDLAIEAAHLGDLIVDQGLRCAKKLFARIVLHVEPLDPCRLLRPGRVGSRPGDRPVFG